MKLCKDFNKASLPRFKKSLFSEGLRQLRAVGIAYTVIAALVTLCFVLPGLRNDDYMHTYTLYNTLDDQLDDTPMGIFLLASFFAVLAVFYITNFMRSAKARDFYCSTPHSHGTLWLNFGASALTWTAAGVLAFFLMCCAVLMSFDPKVIGALFLVACNVFAAVFMVFGMAMLAVTLTGRLVPALATLAGLSVLSLCLKSAYSSGWDSVFTKFNLVTKTSDLELYDPIYYILRRIFLPYSYNNFYSLTVYRVFSSWQTIGYGLLMGAVILAVAAVFGTIRTGDTAGRPFVNKAAHIISLTAVTLPIGTGISYLFFRVCEHVVYNNLYNLVTFVNESGLIPFLLAVLFVAGSFWAVELLLTFDIRHSHRAFKYLPIPVAVTMAAMLFGFFVMKAEFNNVPAADEVASFTLVRNESLPDELAVFRMSETFGRCVTDKAEITDKETIRYVTGIMKELSDKNGHDLKKAYNAPTIWENEETGDYNVNHDGKGNTFITLRLNLKNGKHLYRTVAFDTAHIKGLETAMLSDSNFMKAFLTVPAAEKINIDIQEHNGMTDSESVAVYDSFIKEYNALSDDRKLAYIKAGVMSSYSYDDYAEEEMIDKPEMIEPERVEETVQPISRTDLSLISQSKKTGDFGITESYYNEMDYEGTVTLMIAGYPEGSLYDVNQYFCQSFELDNKHFPETIALTVKTCNAKFDAVRDEIRKAGTNGEYRFCDIDASYHSGRNQLNVLYLYISGKDSEDIRLNDFGTASERFSDEEEKVTYKEIEVDSNEMIERLLKDTASTQTIDFTKPYCRFYWHNSNIRRNGLPSRMTFYAQTKSPVDYLHLLTADEAKEETKGKKK